MIKMKQIYLFLSLVLLCACSSDEELSTVAQQPCHALELTVSAGGFVTDGSAPGTRTADIGYTTVFQDGDRLGIVAEQVDGSKQNLCATYNGATQAWEGIYYDSKVKTYISAYFPYQERLTDQLNNISDADGVLSALKTLMPPLADQSSLAAYRASDLLAGTCTLHTEGGKSLKVALSHAYSLLLLRAGTEYTTSDGFVYRTPLRDVQVNVDDAVCTPFASAEGYRLIVDKSGSPSVAWFYTLPDGKTYKVAGNASLTEGTYHLYKNVTPGGNRDLAVGDYYYSDGGIVPGGTPAPPGEGCIGVIYWVGDKAFQDDPLLKKDHPGCTHGLVAALQDAGETLWSSRNDDITNNWLSGQNDTYGIATLKTTDKMQGYANTKALEDYNASERATGGYSVLPIGLIRSYAGAHPAPASSSGWYFPSIKELKFMCWGQNASGESTDGKKKLDEQFEKITGASSLQSSYYWSSTEISSGWTWGVNFNSGYVLNENYKQYYSDWVRAVLAF